MKPAPDQTRHARLDGGENGSNGAPNSGLFRKLRFSSILRQVRQRRRPLLFCLRLLLGLTTLGLIISRVDLRGATVRPNPHLLAAVTLATALWVLSQAVAAFRWKLILADERLPWSYLLRLYMIGAFFGLFLPTSVGGDAVRAMAAARSSERAGGAIATVLIDRGFGVLAILTYAILGLGIAPGAVATLRRSGMHWQIPWLTATICIIAAISLALFGAIRSNRVRTFWKDGMAALQGLIRVPARLVRVAALAVVSQGLVILLWYTLASGMRFAIPPTTFLWAVPVVSLSALLPLTFAGLGLREGVWLVLLAGTGIAPADIVAFSLLYFACNILVGVLGAFLFVSSGLTVDCAHRARA